MSHPYRNLPQAPTDGFENEEYDDHRDSERRNTPSNIHSTYSANPLLDDTDFDQVVIQKADLFAQISFKRLHSTWPPFKTTIMLKT